MQVKCTHCNKEFYRIKSQVKRSVNHFCSKSCSTTFNNIKCPKRIATKKKCLNCGDMYTGRRTNKCFDCRLDTNLTKLLTLEQHYERNEKSIKNNHPSWKNAAIRTLNRYWNKNLKLNGCKICGYTNHVELAHIKAISSFPITATLGEINSVKNVIPLCPNHHWEFDNGILTI